MQPVASKAARVGAMVHHVECGGADQAGQWHRDLLVDRGPSLYVDIGFDPTYDPDRPSKAPQAGVKNVWALIDTGAVESFIDNGLALSLALPIVDRVQLAGISGRHLASVYVAQIHVPSLAFTIYGRFAGVDLLAGGQTHTALIGRTFLANFKMTYDGRLGRVVLQG